MSRKKVHLKIAIADHPQTEGIKSGAIPIEGGPGLFAEQNGACASACASHAVFRYSMGDTHPCPA